MVNDIISTTIYIYIVGFGVEQKLKEQDKE
jgi:hypothetical protein